MARMYPRTLLETELKSRGEKRVFDALRDGLDDSWEVFHSVGWVDRDHAEGADDGEIDFVLVHPDHPIICLEVKGGGIESQYGEWFWLIDGERKRIPDPFAQALDHRYALERKLAGATAWDGTKPAIGHGLAFPDITVHELALAPDAPPELILDRNDLADPEQAIERLIRYHRGSRDKRALPGAEGADELRELLSPNVRIEVPMAARFLDEAEALITLTHEQSRLLSRFAGNRRMLVRGCAGSGKTTIAVEIAKRLRRDEREVLFVCFNRALRDHLREHEAKSGIKFQTFHGLCVELASRAGIELPEHDGPPPQEFFRYDLPAALMEAAEKLEEPFDALVVDEAQDLHRDWLDALFTLLRDPEHGPVWLFMDDNQDVYDVKLDPPAEYVRYDLTVNCRNTQAIAREVHKKYRGEIEPEILGPEGREVELIHTDDQPRTVAAIIERLCGKEEVPPQDVVVLSSHGIERSEVAEAGAGRFEFTKEYVPVGDYIRFSSIRAFKGLESPVVILCELEDIDEETLDSQLYVGISRARNHCVIVAPRGQYPGDARLASCHPERKAHQ